ncbi:hypothetical protein ACIPZF_12105 [Pseudomonas sp. NPDC089752]|uniref:hypothetical protein n=1 Tax=Pseudomonas sp. NPDC089752 TaxID=3364472 RepID=UPI0037FCF686
MGAAEEYLRVRKKQKKENVSFFLKVFVVALGTVSAGITSLASFNEFIGIKDKSISEKVYQFTESTKEIYVKKTEYEAMREEIDSLRASFKNLQAQPSETQTMFRVESFEEKLKSLDNRLSILEGAISNSPEKALSVPMLRKDHDTLAKQVTDNAASSKSEYDRLWGILMLILGTATSAVALIGGWFIKDIVKKTSPASAPETVA